MSTAGLVQIETNYQPAASISGSAARDAGPAGFQITDNCFAVRAADHVAQQEIDDPDQSSQFQQSGDHRDVVDRADDAAVDPQNDDQHDQAGAQFDRGAPLGPKILNILAIKPTAQFVHQQIPFPTV